MKITITKRQEYVNDEAKEPNYSVNIDFGGDYSTRDLYLTPSELLQLRDELNKLKL